MLIYASYFKLLFHIITVDLLLILVTSRLEVIHHINNLFMVIKF